MRGIVLVLAVAAAFVIADTSRVQRDVRTKRFATAIVCETCHSNADDSGAMRDHQGRGIAPHDLWQSSMMANAARDPFFRAVVAAEAVAAGADSAAMEARCLHCHAPMASYEARVAGRTGLALAQLDNEDDDDDWDVAALARDGVSCTLCHQIQPGAKPDGEFTVGDDREIYGPFDQQFGLAMHRVTKYWPKQGKHMLKSEQCVSCHTSTMPGEVTFLEWENSTREETCQECHMPSGNRTRIARTSHGGDIASLIPRSPVGKHLFVGGNTLVPKILRDNMDALHVKAPRAAFDATIAAARTMLREKTARVSIEEARPGVEGIRIAVKVENLTGHKFPTGHPSRRAWLWVRVFDAKGKLVYESGRADAKGRLAQDGKDDALLPHFAESTAPSRIQIYEAVLKGSRIRSHGSRELVKDNRLLPAGWSPKHANAAATKPIGVGADEDFVAGSDSVVYIAPGLENLPFPYTVEVALLYQPISPRYLAELFAVDHPEVQRFQRMYEAAGNAPEVLARDKLVVIE